LSYIEAVGEQNESREEVTASDANFYLVGIDISSVHFCTFNPMRNKVSAASA